MISFFAESGGSSPITTRGDMLRGDASGDEERFAKGSAKQPLAMDSAGDDPEWSDEIKLTRLVLYDRGLSTHRGVYLENGVISNEDE